MSRSQSLCKAFEFGMRLNDLFDIGRSGNARRTDPIQWQLGTQRRRGPKSCACPNPSAVPIGYDAMEGLPRSPSQTQGVVAGIARCDRQRSAGCLFEMGEADQGRIAHANGAQQHGDAIRVRHEVRGQFGRGELRYAQVGREKSGYDNRCKAAFGTSQTVALTFLNISGASDFLLRCNNCVSHL
ncbi:MAG: hypothetical protein JWO15_2291 [Sphingomonadales bacterium]|nr:hypothetical protein [Sphingomonadales bacterium]